MDNAVLHARKFSIRFTVGCIFLMVTGLTAVFALSLQFHFGRAMSEELVLTKLTTASSKISAYIQGIDIDASRSIKVLKDVSVTSQHKFSEQEIRDLLVQVLQDNPMFYSIYYGKPDEDFYQVINLESSPVVREKIFAADKDHWVIIKISSETGQRIRNTHYYDSQLNLTNSTSKISNYFPTQRPWYNAATANKVHKTDPYLFKHLKLTGQTYSIRTPKAVLGIDIVLSSVNSKLSAASLGLEDQQGIESFIFSHNGELIASNQNTAQQLEIPASEPLQLSPDQQRLINAISSLTVSNQTNWPPLDYSVAGEPKGYAIDLLTLVSEMTGLKFEFINGFSLNELQSKFHDGDIDILHSVSGLKANRGEISQPMYTKALAVAVEKHTTGISKLSDLNGLRLGLPYGQGLTELLKRQGVEATLQGFPDLETTIKALQNGRIDAIVHVSSTLKHFSKTSIGNMLKVIMLPELKKLDLHLYLQPDQAELMEIMNLALANVTPAQREVLDEKWLSEGIHTQHNNFVPYDQLLDLSRNPSVQQNMIKMEVNGSNKFFYVTPLHGQGWNKEFFAVVIPEKIVTEAVFGQIITSTLMTGAVLLLLVPFAWWFGSPIVRAITSLKEETKKVKERRFDEIQLVDTRIKEIWQLSNSVLDMSKDIKKHQQDQNDFIEAFIRLTAQAIDDKSPYTAGHCNRVPELGLMLAKAAEDSNKGKFRKFRFANDNERREFRIAAWLHDCGKITTPEFIVDKGTKLEANYNRIHEVRTRFEVLWRDAEIEYLKTLQKNPESESIAAAKLQQQQNRLQEEFRFIASANVGGEFISDEKVERIKAISQQTWMRHFDDRLGLGPLEEMNRPATEQSLPVAEPLLADRPEHIIKRDREMQFDPKFNIKMDVPEHLYNQGEIYNLSIGRGTLNAEDRFKINEHVISGIKILEALPFPEELSKVPRYATTHHETLKGTGYPRKLTAEDLSIPERILVIADIFEALTAADRPYKKAKPLSVAVDIMYKMALDEHVDMELFLLFLESGTYLQYAKKFLPDEQIDPVDLRKYLEQAAA
ncbi:HD domain-containing phosphohydrolase [Aliamphritea spongicola]|uniref:HD domain-containing phosphohydrolase n=1 Tax=Aliamphritea spongicola TaxID=707589 RepID=UPI00196A81FE|nr:HD domain-containing phosphohydrolase [Aliamphritea spongicola]MBN3561492.1 transporter substrate-binding domain-containing protein [Aliamphritea spongicola]